MIKKIAQRIDKTHLAIGLLVLSAIILGYLLVGNIEETAQIEQDSAIISVFGFEFDLRQTSLLVASIIIGFLDGFNPCAMWVLVYLITMVSTLKDKRKMIFIVGTFVVTEAIMYFLVLGAWFNLFSAIISYTKWIIYAAAGFALWYGITSIIDWYKKGGMITCEVGDMESKKRTMMKIKDIVHSPITLVSIAATIILAIGVNAIEFVCSIGLPAVYTQMLALADISTFSKYMYILVYDFFFMLDDFIVFALAFYAFQSDWMQRYSGLAKVVGGVIMVLLGLMLLFFPNFLF